LHFYHLIRYLLIFVVSCGDMEGIAQAGSLAKELLELTVIRADDVVIYRLGLVTSALFLCAQ
jgi:hypothetical protein